jgi:hypothetical protein
VPAMWMTAKMTPKTITPTNRWTSSGSIGLAP